MVPIHTAPRPKRFEGKSWTQINKNWALPRDLFRRIDIWACLNIIPRQAPVFPSKIKYIQETSWSIQMV